MVRRFILGPWPLSLTVTWTFASVFCFTTLFRIYGPLPLIPQDEPFASRIAHVLALSVVMPGFMAVPLLIYRWIRRRRTDRAMRWPEYLLALAGAAVIGALSARMLLRDSHYFQEALNSPRFLGTTVRFFIVFWFINAVIGTFFVRIQKESNAAQDALRTVVAQRRMLLESEERVRGQVAAFLHDRVQTDLVSIALRVRATIGQDPAAMNSELTAVISDLERVRSQEVRRASRRLSPILATVSFDMALRDLAESYRPAMDISIHVDEPALRTLTQSSDDSLATGLYRICEQALLNAAAHGHATICSIHVAQSPGSGLTLRVSDNGIGLPSSAITPGMGSAVISAWTESLDGHWSLESVGSGTVLTATISASR